MVHEHTTFLLLSFDSNFVVQSDSALLLMQAPNIVMIANSFESPLIPSVCNYTFTTLIIPPCTVYILPQFTHTIHLYFPVTLLPLPSPHLLSFSHTNWQIIYIFLQYQYLLSANSIPGLLIHLYLTLSKLSLQSHPKCDTVTARYSVKEDLC